jgi:hypothetical protein
MEAKAVDRLCRSIFLKISDFLSKSHPTQRARSCTVAISKTTEKRKDGRLCHPLAVKENLPEFHYDLPQTACG